MKFGEKLREQALEVRKKIELKEKQLKREALMPSADPPSLSEMAEEYYKNIKDEMRLAAKEGKFGLWYIMFHERDFFEIIDEEFLEGASYSRRDLVDEVCYKFESIALRIGIKVEKIDRRYCFRDMLDSENYLDNRYVNLQYSYTVKNYGIFLSWKL